MKQSLQAKLILLFNVLKFKVMATQRQNANANTQSNANESEKQVYTLNVKRVLTSDLLDRNRITLVLSEEITTLDKDGSEIQSNSISLNGGQFANAEIEGFDELSLYHVLAMGQPINKQIYALALSGALITFEREKLPIGYITAKGETLAKPAIKTQIVKCVCNVNPTFKEMIKKIANTQLIEPKKVVVADADDLF